MRGVLAVGQCRDEPTVLQSGGDRGENHHHAYQSIILFGQEPAKYDAENHVENLHRTVVHRSPEEAFCGLFFKGRHWLLLLSFVRVKAAAGYC